MAKYKRTLRNERAWKAETKSQRYWSLTRYFQLAHNEAQRCCKNHPGVCTSIAFDTLKWRVKIYFSCCSAFPGAMQRKSSRHGTHCPPWLGHKCDLCCSVLQRKFRETPSLEYLCSCGLPLSKNTWILGICGHCCSLPKTSWAEVNAFQTWEKWENGSQRSTD